MKRKKLSYTKKAEPKKYLNVNDKKEQRLLAKKLQKFYLKNTINFIVVVASLEERIKSNQGKLYIIF